MEIAPTSYLRVNGASIVDGRVMASTRSSTCTRSLDSKTTTGTPTTQRTGRSFGSTPTSRSEPSGCGRCWPITTKATGGSPASTCLTSPPTRRAADSSRGIPRQHAACVRSTRTGCSSLTGTSTRPTSPCSPNLCPTRSTRRTTTSMAGLDPHGHYPGELDGRYPGSAKGDVYNKDTIHEQFLRRTAFMRGLGLPIWIGEFGPLYNGTPDQAEERYHLAAGPARHLPGLSGVMGAVALQGRRIAGPGFRCSR